MMLIKKSRGAITLQKVEVVAHLSYDFITNLQCSTEKFSFFYSNVFFYSYVFCYVYVLFSIYNIMAMFSTGLHCKNSSKLKINMKDSKNNQQKIFYCNSCYHVFFFSILTHVQTNFHCYSFMVHFCSQ
jgi:hypothetical protein